MKKETRLYSRWLIGIGAAGLMVVILTHVAERFYIFPTMGWALPDSLGHYVDRQRDLRLVLIPRPCPEFGSV